MSISPPIARGPPIPAAGAISPPKQLRRDGGSIPPYRSLTFFCFLFCLFLFQGWGGLGGLGGCRGGTWAPAGPRRGAAVSASAPARPSLSRRPSIALVPSRALGRPGPSSLEDGALPSRPALTASSLRASARPRVARRPSRGAPPAPRAGTLLPAPCSERTCVPARHASCVMQVASRNLSPPPF